MLAVILGAIYGRFHDGRYATKSPGRALFGLAMITVILTTFISAAAWALYSTYEAKIISGEYNDDLFISSIRVDIAYEAIYLLVTLIAFGPAVVLITRSPGIVSHLHKYPFRPLHR
jgi:hypothetical protein